MTAGYPNSLWKNPRITLEYLQNTYTNNAKAILVSKNHIIHQNDSKSPLFFRAPSMGVVGREGAIYYFLPSLKRRWPPLSPPPPWKGGSFPEGIKPFFMRWNKKKKNHKQLLLFGVLDPLSFSFFYFFLFFYISFPSSPFSFLHLFPFPSSISFFLMFLPFPSSISSFSE